MWPAQVLLQLSVVCVSFLGVLVTMRMSDDARARKVALRRVSEPEEAPLATGPPGRRRAAAAPPSGAAAARGGVRELLVAVGEPSERSGGLRGAAPGRRGPGGALPGPRGAHGGPPADAGVRCFLSGTSEGHVRKILPWVRSHPEVVVCSPTSTALPGASRGPAAAELRAGHAPRRQHAQRDRQVRRQRGAGPPPRLAGAPGGGEAADGAAARAGDPAPLREAAAGADRGRRAAGGPHGAAAPPAEEPEDPLRALHTAVVLYADTAYGEGLVEVLRAQLPAMNLGVAVRYVPIASDPEATVRLLDAMAGPERVAVVVYLGFGADFNGYARLPERPPGAGAEPHPGPGGGLRRGAAAEPGRPAPHEERVRAGLLRGGGLRPAARQLAARMDKRQVVGPASALQHDALSLLAAAERRAAPTRGAPQGGRHLRGGHGAAPAGQPRRPRRRGLQPGGHQAGARLPGLEGRRDPQRRRHRRGAAPARRRGLPHPHRLQAGLHPQVAAGQQGAAGGRDARLRARGERRRVHVRGDGQGAGAVDGPLRERAGGRGTSPT